MRRLESSFSAQFKYTWCIVMYVRGSRFYRTLFSLLLLSLLFAMRVDAQNFLANNTVLIIRHAEKPTDASGNTGLTDFGQRRAAAYAKYFQPFREGGVKLEVSALFAGADSAGSIRPRLTLEPLAKALSVPLNTSISTKSPEDLVAFLRAHPHGQVPLICWRHGQMAGLLTAFGVTPKTLLPDGKWPDDVFDWVLVLHLDSRGAVDSQELRHETLVVR